MTDAETVELYSTLLWWFLILLAAGGVPIALGGIAAMVMRIRTMDAWMQPTVPPPPPPPPSSAQP